MKSKKREIIGYIVGGLLTLIIIPLAIFVISNSLSNVIQLEKITTDQLIKNIIAIVLVLLGFPFALWSLVIQNKIGKGGPVQIGNIEISPKTKNLVITGPYKYTRNPMLFGACMMYLGYAIYLNSIYAILVVFLFLIFMLSIVVRMEEKRLLSDFGKDYEDYKRKTSKFFPWFQKK